MNPHPTPDSELSPAESRILTSAFAETSDLVLVTDRMMHFASQFCTLGFRAASLEAAATPQGRENFELGLQEGVDGWGFVDLCVACTLADSPAQVPNLIKQLRYRNGEVSWPTRRHYAFEWIRDGLANGFFEEPLTEASPNQIRAETRTLSYLNHVNGVALDLYPPVVDAQLKYLKPEVAREGARFLRSGDILCFGTATQFGKPKRFCLDVRGLAIYHNRGPNEPMIHYFSAGRARHEQPHYVGRTISEFLDGFGETPGFLVTRVKRR